MNGQAKTDGFGMILASFLTPRVISPHNALLRLEGRGFAVFVPCAARSENGA
jgi:hypothetical protein